ncbi:adhesion G-protein coupled receptor G2 isoform X3 [Aquarana catesbeiana]|uniref:adhesion G-protein coupled receptor G2 isoform X3 n=1 Tax=Aquarana catesbeiana TaxID=8400 RepID=UPI003CC925CD
MIVFYALCSHHNAALRMLLHGFLHAFIGKSKYPLVKCKSIQPIWILLYILTTQGIAQAANVGEFKAVFDKPCTKVMTLSSPVLNLTEFTLCTYIKLDSSDPWTAFTYKLKSSPSNVYEIGLLGDSSSIKLWMFGTPINVYKSLNLLTWYEMCITWSAQTQNMDFYIDGTLEDKRTLENYTELQGGGNVVLGCSDLIETNSTISVGLVGELYMFRMWGKNDIGYFRKCIDGDVIKWDIGHWIYIPDVVQQDLTLHCANQSKENPANKSGFSTTQEYVQPATSTTAPSINNTSIGNTPQTSSKATNGLTFTSSDVNSRTPNDSPVTTDFKNTTSGLTITSSDVNSRTPNGTPVTTSSLTFTSSDVNSRTPNDSLVTTDFKNTTSGLTFTSSDINSRTPNDSPVTTDFKNTTSGRTVSDVSPRTANDTPVTTDIYLPGGPTVSDVSPGTPDETYGRTDFKSTTSGVNMTCVQNYSTEVQNLYSNICYSNFSCKGTVYEVILQGNCTDEKNGEKLLVAMRINYTLLPFQGGCSILINDNTSICKLEIIFLNLNLSLSINATNIVEYCCCDEKCRQSPECFRTQNFTCKEPSTGSTGITTTGLKTTGYSNTVVTITSGSSTTTNNITHTTVNSQPFTTNKNGPNTTVWHTESVSITSTDSNRTINSETTVIINSSTKTTGNKGSTTSSNRISSPKIISVPTTSLSNESSTYPKRTGSTGLRTTLPEFSISSGTTNQSVDLGKDLTHMEDLLAGEVTSEVAKEMLGILNSILSRSQNFSSSDSVRLIKIVDKIGLKLNFPGQSINLTSQYLALAVNKVNASDFPETSFGVESSSGLQVTLDSRLPENSTGSVLLPATLLNDLSAADKDIASRVQFNYFAKASFFVDSSLTGYQYLVSNVISASVANLSITNLKQNVTVTLETSTRNDSGVLKCVFWDFTKNSGNGGWSSEGCTLNSTTQNNQSQTVCKCNHLTSFGILLDMTPNNPVSPEDKLILTFITYIGCGLSAIFLSVTLVTYIAFEKIRRDYPSKILIQLCAALIGLNLTFLMDPWIAMYSEVPGLCISVAAFLHYFLLVSITWMGLEAFHMYLSLVKVFNTYIRKYMLKFCIIGWGAPAVVVAIILAVNKDLYELQISEPYPNGAADYFCWMQSIIYWITVVGYFCIIFLLNVSMFVVVLIQLCRIKKQKQLGYQRKTMLQDVRSVAGITCLLGITWGLGFFSFGPGKTVIQYLFAIFNSLQGFFIFFFYCVAKENVRKQWRRYLCCGKLRLAENSDWSKTATNKLKKQTSKQGVSSSSSNSIQSTSNSNSTTLLVSNEYLMHPNGNGNVFKERNGVTFMPQNGEVQLQEFPGRPATRNGDDRRNSMRRTNRGSVHFVDQI